MCDLFPDTEEVMATTIAKNLRDADAMPRSLRDADAMPRRAEAERCG